MALVAKDDTFIEVHKYRAGSVIGGNVWLVESVPPGSKISYNAPIARGGAARVAR